MCLKENMYTSRKC